MEPVNPHCCFEWVDCRVPIAGRPPVAKQYPALRNWPSRLSAENWSQRRLQIQRKAARPWYPRPIGSVGSCAFTIVMLVRLGIQAVPTCYTFRFLFNFGMFLRCSIDPEISRNFGSTSQGRGTWNSDSPPFISDRKWWPINLVVLALINEQNTRLQTSLSLRSLLVYNQEWIGGSMSIQYLLSGECTFIGSQIHTFQSDGFKHV